VCYRINRFENFQDYQKFVEGNSWVLNSKGDLRFLIEQAENNVLDLIRTRFDFTPQVLPQKLRVSRKPTWQLTISSKKRS